VGGNGVASPSDETEAGRSILAEHPDSNGSLGIAISEAVEVAAKSGGDCKYSLGSVLNHVLMHQTIIGEEALEQMELAGKYPDVGDRLRRRRLELCRDSLSLHARKFVKGRKTRFVAVEPTACPTLTRGVYAYDFATRPT